MKQEEKNGHDTLIPSINSEPESHDIHGMKNINAKWHREFGRFNCNNARR